MCKLCKLCIKNDGRSGGFLAISKQKTPKMTKTPEKNCNVVTNSSNFSCINPNNFFQFEL